LLDGFRPNAGSEAVRILLHHLPVLFFRQQLTPFEGGFARIEDDEGVKIEDFFQFAQGQIQDVADFAREAPQKPDVGDRRGQLNMSHPLATYLGLNDLDPALLTDHPAMLHPFVLAAVALVVLDRSEDPGTKQPIPFRLEGAVIDGLRLLHLAVGPFSNPLRRSDHDLHRIKMQRVLGLHEKTVELFQRNLLS